MNDLINFLNIFSKDTIPACSDVLNYFVFGTESCAKIIFPLSSSIFGQYLIKCVMLVTYLRIKEIRDRSRTSWGRDGNRRSPCCLN